MLIYSIKYNRRWILPSFSYRDKQILTTNVVHCFYASVLTKLDDSEGFLYLTDIILERPAS